MKIIGTVTSVEMLQIESAVENVLYVTIETEENNNKKSYSLPIEKDFIGELNLGHRIELDINIIVNPKNKKANIFINDNQEYLEEKKVNELKPNESKNIVPMIDIKSLEEQITETDVNSFFQLNKISTDLANELKPISISHIENNVGKIYEGDLSDDITKTDKIATSEDLTKEVVEKEIKDEDTEEKKESSMFITDKPTEEIKDDFISEKQRKLAEKLNQTEKVVEVGKVEINEGIIQEENWEETEEQE